MMTDSLVGPVLLTAKMRTRDAPSAMVWLRPGSGVPLVVSNAMPRSLATVTNGRGTKVTIRVTTAANPQSFRRRSRCVSTVSGGGTGKLSNRVERPDKDPDGFAMPWPVRAGITDDV